LARGTDRPAEDRLQVLVYFFALGLAFLFVEIASIQRFVLFLGHPLYAVTIVISAFLLFAGLGSGYGSRLLHRLKGLPVAPIPIAVAGIVLFGAIHLAILPSLFATLAQSSQVMKVIVSLLLIAPLAFFMGMPFPLGLARTAARTPEMVPWAWGVNGCASVLSAVLAALLGIHFGFTMVVFLALVLYVGAALVFVERS